MNQGFDDDCTLDRVRKRSKQGQGYEGNSSRQHVSCEMGKLNQKNKASSNTPARNRCGVGDLLEEERCQASMPCPPSPCLLCHFCPIVKGEPGIQNRVNQTSSGRDIFVKFSATQYREDLEDDGWERIDPRRKNRGAGVRQESQRETFSHSPQTIESSVGQMVRISILAIPALRKLK